MCPSLAPYRAVGKGPPTWSWGASPTDTAVRVGHGRGMNPCGSMLIALAVLAVLAAGPATTSATDALITDALITDGLIADVRSTEVSITVSDGATRHGTVVAPADIAAPGPAMVLVHGGGAGPREWLRQEAEAFARAGIVTLIYDKRTDGYTLTQRSYQRLADDALAAVRRLRTWPGVDPDRVGLWGVSEGGWVAPLAAVASEEVAFVITVGASGVPRPDRRRGRRRTACAMRACPGPWPVSIPGRRCA